MPDLEEDYVQPLKRHDSEERRTVQQFADDHDRWAERNRQDQGGVAGDGNTTEPEEDEELIDCPSSEDMENLTLGQTSGLFK